MPTQTDIETADRLTRRRARTLPVLAIIFITQQASYFAGQMEGHRAVDNVRIGAWLVLSIVLLLALTTGGFWFKPKHIRALMDDEVTRANRADALRVGFLATMLGGIALYFVSYYETISGREAIHAMVSFGLVAALVRFGMLERRAFKDG